MNDETETYRDEFKISWLPWDQRDKAPRHNGELGRCCEQAEEMTCVCAAAWTCPVHGTLHVGSHD